MDEQNQNPAAPGAFDFEEVIYAAPGLDYSDQPSLREYTIYHEPTPAYETRRIDISDFATVPSIIAWPFTYEEAPINGYLRVPIGDGPFPLVLFAHGNHLPASTVIPGRGLVQGEDSTPGYLYLCELLASHGIIAGTIDANYLNFTSGENDARAILHLEHIRQFQIWHETEDHPLAGKVNLDKIMIAGHSRGGEAVGHATFFNGLSQRVPDLLAADDFPVPLDGSQGLGPYGFNISAAVAIAPTDGQFRPVLGERTIIRDNYIVLHGSRDGDVLTFDGQLTYDRAHPIDLAEPTRPAQGFKALVWIYGANHNFFNSAWPIEAGTSDSLTRPVQEEIAKVYIGAIARSMLLDETDYLDLLQDQRIGILEEWIDPDVTIVSQYQDPERRFIQHFEEPGPELVTSNPVRGAVDTIGMEARKLFLNEGPRSPLFQESFGLRLNWAGPNRRYRVRLNPATLTQQGATTQEFTTLALRVGQSAEPSNSFGRAQNFTLLVGDGQVTLAINAAAFGELPYPAQLVNGTFRTVMQTLRVPLELLRDNGLNTDNIVEISLFFNRPISGTNLRRGTLYLDEIQLSR